MGVSLAHRRADVRDADQHANPVRDALRPFDLVEVAGLVVIDRGPGEGSEVASVRMRRDRLRLLQRVGGDVGVEAALDHLLARGGCQVDVAHSQCRATNHASAIHAAMKQTPPIGVIAPSARFPVTASRYRLPEKITMPGQQQPADPRCRELGKRPGLDQERDDQQTQRVDEVVEDGLLVDAHGIGVQARRGVRGRRTRRERPPTPSVTRPLRSSSYQ